MTTKAELHQLIDQLPEHAVPAVARILEAVRDMTTDAGPAPRLPDDPSLADDPLTDEDRAAIAEGRAQYQRDLHRGRW